MPFKITFRSGAVLYPFSPLRTIFENRQIKAEKFREAFADQLPYGERAESETQMIEIEGPHGRGLARDHFDYRGNIPLSPEGVRRRAELMAARQPIKIQKQDHKGDTYVPYNALSFKDVGEVL